MKSYEQIAEKMYEAYVYDRKSLKMRWATLPFVEKSAWIAAATAAHKEIMEVH